MVANMKVGQMDGFCVGEPWNARAIADQIGYTAITTQELWKDPPRRCARSPRSSPTGTRGR
ncbi:ABC transporter substrate-binding protein [Sorangium sp. So ce590]